MTNDMSPPKWIRELHSYDGLSHFPFITTDTDRRPAKADRVQPTPRPNTA